MCALDAERLWDIIDRNALATGHTDASKIGIKEETEKGEALKLHPILFDSCSRRRLHGWPANPSCNAMSASALTMLIIEHSARGANTGKASRQRTVWRRLQFVRRFACTAHRLL